jgi:Domain of unknown function (DUF4476)
MKKNFTLFIVLFASVMAFANSPFRSKLTVSSVRNTSIKVVVDNDRFDRFDNGYNSYENSGNGVIITDLPSGYHTVRVYENRAERKRGGWGFGKRNRFEDYRLLYTTSVYIRPFVHINILINRFGQAEVNEINMKNRRHGDYDRDDDDNDRRRDRDWDNNRGFDRGRGREDDFRGVAAMNVNQYNAVRQTIQRESFDKGKMAIAFQVLRDNYVSSAQVKELTMLFAFDDAKLEFAKYAYPKTIDRGSFFMVYDAFSFSSTKERLADYIRNYR